MKAKCQEGLGDRFRGGLARLGRVDSTIPKSRSSGAAIVVDMEANGEKVPTPISEKEYSGKFQVRIPPERHRMLAIEAAEQNVSLNRYVAHKLAC